MNGLKASRFFSLAEHLNLWAAPFIWLFIRPPWSLSGSCCKAVVYESLKTECQMQKVSHKFLCLFVCFLFFSRVKLILCPYYILEPLLQWQRELIKIPCCCVQMAEHFDLLGSDLSLLTSSKSPGFWPSFLSLPRLRSSQSVPHKAIKPLTSFHQSSQPASQCCGAQREKTAYIFIHS